MSLLREIRSQPEHIRSVFMWLSVIISFSIVSFFWFKSTAKDFVAIVNPTPEIERAFAQEDQEATESLFANIGLSIKDFTREMNRLLGFTNEEDDININNQPKQAEIKPRKFPVQEGYETIDNRQ